MAAAGVGNDNCTCVQYYSGGHPASVYRNRPPKNFLDASIRRPTLRYLFPTFDHSLSIPRTNQNRMWTAVPIAQGIGNHLTRINAPRLRLPQNLSSV